jgi:5,10-methylenetetrahydromethanopterin reductase
MGYEQHRPAAHCREAINLCRELLRGRTVYHRSELFVADGIELEMAPHPDVPIYLAARGPRVIEVAGEVADTAVIGALISEDGVRYAVEHIRIGAEKAGRKPADLGIMLWISCYITDDSERWIEHYRPSAAHILAGAPPAVFDALKLTPTFMHELKAQYAEGGSRKAAALVSNELVTGLAAIGSASAITDQLQRAATLGINEIGILVNAPTVDESKQFIRRFAEDVMPRLA